jgi:tripeptide aminopeptidase
MAQINEEGLAHRPVEIIFTIAEEGGLRGAKNLDYSRVRSKKAVILDSSGSVGNIIVQAPAQDKIFATFHGKPAHAGIEPEKGISAIQVAAEAITKMNLLRIDEETTANIGTLRAESATNIVCPLAELIAESRSLNNDKLKAQTAHMVACMEEAAKKFHTTVDVQVETNYSAFNIQESDEFLVELRGIIEGMGHAVKLASTGGGSDANIFNQRGIKALNLGTGMTGAHTLEEHISVKDLTELCEVVKGIATHA